MDSSDTKNALIAEFRKKMDGVPVLLDEEDFFVKDETLTRFLKARDWKINDAEKLLKATVEWRRINRPLHSHCMGCMEQQGYHSMRQVGFDVQGRPVIYSSFTQCSARQNRTEDIVHHVTYLMENATKTMKPGVTQWVMVIDCTGLSIANCSPKLGHGVGQVLADNYPERLGLVFCVNHNPVFQGVWNAIKIFLHPNTVSKVNLTRSKSKVKAQFAKFFSEELSTWLLDEMKLNKQKPLSRSQREFWSAPVLPDEHDPRGCRSYIKNYIETYPETIRSSSQPLLVHRPHPNIVEDLGNPDRRKMGASPAIKNHNDSTQNTATNGDTMSDDEDDDLEEIFIDEEFQIPSNASSVQM